jgi:hypothetical protein
LSGRQYLPVGRQFLIAVHISFSFSVSLIAKMKITRYFHFFFLIPLLFLNSCTDAPSGIGSDFFHNGELNVIYVDTVTLEVSTVQFDSLITTNPSRFLIGTHTDADVGKVSCIPFFQVAPAGELTLDEDFTSFTKAVLVLSYDGYSFYDTTKQMTIKIHQLSEEMEMIEDNLYSTSSFSYDASPLGSLTFTPKPNHSDTLEIPLSDDFGKEIIRLAQKEHENVSSTAAFLEYFYGIAIVPEGSGEGAVVGFSPDSEIRIYYMDKSKTPGEEKYLTLPTGSNLRFNHLTTDKSLTSLSTLTQQRYHLRSSLTNKRAYLQSGSGLALRVGMPYLREILRENENLIITDAILELVPIKGIHDPNTPLPSALLINAVNYRNLSYASYPYQAQLIEDPYLGRDTHYSVNVKDFIMQQLAIEEFNDNALLFTLNDIDFRSSVNRIYVGDQKNDYEMKLKIYCLTY